MLSIGYQIVQLSSVHIAELWRQIYDKIIIKNDWACWNKAFQKLKPTTNIVL
jgi:hypothetical protein